MPQEPTTQEPAQPIGEPSVEQITQARSVLNMVQTIPVGEDGALTGAHDDLLETIEHPTLRMQVKQYAQESSRWNSYSDMLSGAVNDGTVMSLHDFLEQPQVAVGGAIQDFGKTLANVADKGLNFAQRQIGMRESQHPFREALAGVAEWTQPGAGELYGYDGSVQDYYKEALAGSLVEAARMKAQADGDPRAHLFLELPKDQQMALAMDQIYGVLDKEASEMGFFDHAEHAAKTMGPQLAVWLMTEGAAATRFGSAMKSKAAGTRFSARMAQAAPRLGKLFQFGAGAFSAGAVAGAFDAMDPLTPYEKDLVHRSPDPEATADAILTNRMVHMMVAWPVYEIIGAGGNRVTQALNKRSGEALVRPTMPMWMRVRNGMAGGATTGTGFAMLPIFEQAVNADDREAMWTFVEQAYAGELDVQELKAWAGQSFGGSVVPFAIISGLMNMRAMPGMSESSRGLIDGIAKEVIREAPPELKELLLAEQAHSLSSAEGMFKSMLERDIATDIAALMREGKSEFLRADHEVQLTEWLQRHRPELSKEEAGYHARSAIRESGKETKAEQEVLDLATGEPLAAKVEKELKAGNFSLKDWVKGETGNILQAGYARLLLRRIMARKVAFEDGVARQQQKGQAGEGVGDAVYNPPTKAPGLPAGRPQRALGEGPPKELKPQELEAPPSDPQGVKWPAPMRPTPRMTRVSKELKAWAESVQDLPEATARVENLVNSGRARTDVLAAVGRTIGDQAPKVVERWDDIVESPEWNHAASNVIAYYGRTVDSSSKRISNKQVARSIMDQVKRFAVDHGQPQGSTPAVNEAQILRRVVGALMETPGGVRTAEYLMSRNVEYLQNLFARESADSSEVKGNWARARKQFQVYVPARSKEKTSENRQAYGRQYNRVVRRVAKGVLESMNQSAERRKARRQPKEQEQQQPKLEEPAQEQGKEVEEPKQEAAEEPVEAEPADLVEPTASEQIVADMVGGQSSKSERIGGALITRTDVYGLDRPVYNGMIRLDAIKRHPDLQPREHAGGRNVDERRVANYAANFKPEAVNPGKFAWLEKDGVEGWYLLDGHHTSALLEDVGSDSMAGTFLKDLTWEEAVDIAHAQNTKREDLSVLETARAVKKMVDSGRFEGDVAVGREWNQGAGWVRSMVNIAELPETVHRMAQMDELGEGQDIIRKTLTKLGEARSSNPDVFNDEAVLNAAKRISQYRWFNTQRKVSDFLDLYGRVGTRELERAESAGSQGFLFEGFTPTADAIDIIAQITEARAKGRSASTEVRKARAQLEKWESSASPAEVSNLRGAAEVAERELSLANQRLQYLDVLQERVFQGKMDIEAAKEAAGTQDPEVVQSFLEEISEPKHKEPKQEKEDGLDHPTLERELSEAEGRDREARTDEQAGRVAGGDAGGAGGGGGRGGSGDGKEPAAIGKPAGERVSTVESRPEGFRDWKKAGADEVFSTRAKAVKRAQELSKESLSTEFAVYPVDPAKPTGRSKISWRGRVKQAAQDFMARVKDRPDFQDAMNRLKGIKGIEGKGDRFLSGLNLEALEAAIDIGKIFLEVGLQSARDWGSAMRSKLPEKVHPYLKEIWNAMVVDPKWDHLPQWTAADSKALGLSNRRKPTSQAAKEYREAFRQPSRPAREVDRPEGRLTIEDQIDSVRKEDLERARGKRAQEQSFLLDPFLSDLPAPQSKIEHPVRAKLRDHQKFIGDTFITALLDGGKDAVLDSSGTGTGKTWTVMATLLELQRRRGGKVVLVTSNNAAMESWRKNDFGGMEIDPARVGFLKDLSNPAKDIILASYYNFQERSSAISGKKVGRLSDFDAQVADGTIAQIAWDEAHRAGTWYKGTSEAQRVVERMDAARAAGAKQVFATASPYDSPAGMRWMQALGIWGDDFRGFLEKVGYKTTSKGRQAGLRVTSPPEAQMPYVHMKLIRLRQMLAEQGQQIGWDLSAEGVENVFMKLDYTPEQSKRYWAVAEGYEFLQKALNDAGMSKLSTMAGAWRMNHAKRMIEGISAENAVKFALSAVERGGRFLFLSSYKSAKKEGSLMRILEKPRGEEAVSALARIETSAGAEVAGKVRAMAQRFDQEMGSQPPVLEFIDKKLREKGLRGMKVSGEITPSQRVDVLEQWHNAEQDLDFLIGTRATLGESISAHDTYGRQVFQFVASIPWTGREVVQELGRAHRLSEVTKPVIAWASADEFPASSAMVRRVAARLHSLRAGVQGMRSDPTNLENAKDTAAFFLGSAYAERKALAEVLELESEALRARRAGEGTSRKEPMGVDLTEHAEFFDEPGEIRGTKDLKQDFRPLEDKSSAHDYGSFEAWKEAASETVDVLFEELNPERIEPDSPYPTSLSEFAERSAAARDLAAMMSSRDVRGVEAEAREHIDGLLGGALQFDVQAEGEGLKMPKSAKGSEAGALDTRILAAPWKLAQFLTHAGLKTFWADPLHYERNEYPPHLRLAGNRFNRSLRRWLDDPINVAGYRVVEPFLEANRDWSSDMESTSTAYEKVRKAAIRENGYQFFQGEGLLVVRALNGERYDPAQGPMEGRLGRLEEYQAGAREWTDEQRVRASEEGFTTMEAWLEGQPEYKALMRSGEVKSSTADYYEFARHLLDRIWKLHLSNSPEFRHWNRVREKAYASMQRYDGKEQFHVAAEKYQKAVAEIDKFFSEKGIQDYFTHYWPDRKNLRMLAPWLKKVAGKRVYSEFAEKGRVSHETGWLENAETVVWTYASQMLKKVYMDRAQTQVESTIEGSWKPISGSTLLPLKPEGPEYTKGGKLLESLSKQAQARAESEGDVMRLGHRRVRYEGQIYDAFPGEKRGDMRGLVLRQPQAEGAEPGGEKELFFSAEEAAGLHLEAKVGGIRQMGDSTELMGYLENWLTRLMGGREYQALDRVIDTHTNYFYRTTLGFFNLPIAQTNLLGGQVLNMAKLGPTAMAVGMKALLSPGKDGADLRGALRHSGIFTKAQLAYQMELVAAYRKPRSGVMGQAMETGRLATARVVKTADMLHMGPFMATETFNRMSAFAAGYTSAKRAGMDETEARRQGLRATGSTQFWYESPNQPMISWGSFGRALMQFSTYGLKFFNTFKLDFSHGYRGLKDSLAGHTARKSDVHGAARVLRWGMYAYLSKQLWDVASQYMMNTLFGDDADENEGLDSSYLHGTKLRDAWAGERWWLPIARNLKEKTDGAVDIENLFLPAVQLPFGVSMPAKGGGALLDYGFESAAGDPRAAERVAYKMQQLYIPSQIRRFLQMQDLGGENSEVDAQVEALQEQLRGFQFFGMQPFDSVPEYKDYRKLNRFYDKQQPFLMEDGAGNELYSASGPMTVAKFFLMGTDPRVSRAIHAGQDMRLDRDIRRARKEYIKDEFKALEIERVDGLQQQAYEDRMTGLREFAKEYGIRFGMREQRSWRREAMELRLPAAKQLQTLAADKYQAWENLVGAAERGSITWSAWFEAYRDMRKTRDESFIEWSRRPGNAERLQEALQVMGGKRDNSEETEDAPADRSE